MSFNEMEVSKLQQLYISYKSWITKNPTKASELETVVKWGSYFLAGRFQNASILCEIVYSGSRLFEMFNDYLVCGKLPQLTSSQYDRLSVLLTVVEYVEVLVEVTALQIWGETGRWAVVAIIQLVKAIWRLLMLLKNKTILIASPPLKPVNRKEAAKEIEIDEMSNGFNNCRDKGVIRLPHSGRLIRTLNGTAPPHLRMFSPPVDLLRACKSKNVKQKKISVNQLAAEILHICRPISHLSSMYLFGVKSWVPWCFAFGIDLTSLHLYSNSVLTKEEQLELARRRLSLLYYLIRNPAFHTVTHRRINQFLIAAGNKIPLARFICQPLLEYIPEWQKLYSYTWS